MASSSGHSSRREDTEFALRPGVSLGPFLLGHSINTVLSIIRHDPYLGTSPLVITHSDEDPFEGDFVLHLRDYGLQLVFAGASQVLYRIEVSETSSCPVAFDDTQLCGPRAPPLTHARVSSLFGEPFPGDWDAESGDYLVHHRGFAVLFEGIGKGIGPEKDRMAALLAALRRDGGAAASRLIVFCGDSLYDAASTATKLPSAETPEHVQVVHGRGVRVSGTKSDAGGVGSMVHFGDDVQQVHNALGPASKWRRCHRRSEYAMMYLERGLNVYIDASSMRVVRMQLFQNLPGHALFGTARRSDFNVDVCPRSIRSGTKFAAVRASMQPSSMQIAVHEGGSAGSIPYAVTHVATVPGMLLEFLPGNGGVLVSLTLFATTRALPLSDGAASAPASPLADATSDGRQQASTSSSEGSIGSGSGQSSVVLARIANRKAAKRDAASNGRQPSLAARRLVLGNGNAS